MRYHFYRLLTLFVLVSSQAMAVWNITQMPGASNGNPPSVSCDTHGNATAVWGDQNGSDLLSSFFRDNGWTQPTVVASDTGGALAEVFAYGDGASIAVWQNQVDYTISAARTVDGSNLTWGAPIAPLSIPGGAPFRIAADDAGNVALIYYDITEQLAYVSQLSVGDTAWAAPQALDPTPSMAYPITLDVNNGYAVALRVTNAGEVQAYGYTFGTSTAWEQVGPLLSLPAGFTAMEIDINRNKQAAILFSDYAGVQLPAQAAILDAENAIWSTPVVLSTYNNTLLPSISIDDNYNIMAMWAEEDPSHNFTFRVSTFNDGIWSPAITVSDTFSTFEYYPINAHLMHDVAGNVQALWNVASEQDSLVQVIQKPVSQDWVPVFTLDTNGLLTPYSLLGSTQAIAGMSATFAVWQNADTNAIMLGQDPPALSPAGSILPPNAPRHFRGRIQKRDGAYRLLMKLDKSSSLNVDHYEISRGDTVVATIPANKKHLVVKLILESKKQDKHYRIRAVDSEGNKSLSHKLRLQK